jgi:hypothetical protein
MLQNSKRRVLFYCSVGFTACALVFLLCRTRSDADAFVTRAASALALLGLALALVIEFRQGRKRASPRA